MSNPKKLLVVIVAISVSVLTLGCKDKSTNPGKQPVKEGTDIKNNRVETKIMGDFMKLIKPETDASDLGKYIKDNIKDVDESSAQKMIEYLMIYQTEIIDDFNENLGKPDYIEALNKDMGGDLEQSRIKNISNQEIKQDYQKIIDSFLTIRRYEENPVVETDWKALSKYSSVFPKDLKNIVEINEKVQNGKYMNKESVDKFLLDRFKVAEDTVKVEEILNKNDSEFIKWQANELYELEVSTLLIGAEGEYLDLWRTKDSDEYKSLMKIKDEYPYTKLSELISQLDDLNIEEVGQINDKIKQKLQFGLESDSYLETIKYSDDDNEYNILQLILEDKEDKKKQDRINEMIKDDANRYVNSLETDKSFTLSTFLNFENKKYISYNGFLSYKDPKGDNENLSFYRTINLASEKFITLEEYFDTNFDLIKADLEKITGLKLETMPDFQILDDGITLSLKSAQEDKSQYKHLNYKDLIPYFTLKELRHAR